MRFEVHIIKVARLKLKGCGEDELADVGLYLGLGSLGVANHESLESIQQPASLIDCGEARLRSSATAGVEWRQRWAARLVEDGLL